MEHTDMSWESGYSLLIHNIEGKIAKSVLSGGKDEEVEPSPHLEIPYHKKQRLSTDSQTDLRMYSKNKRTLPSDPPKYDIDRLRLEAKIDEVMIMNEKLNEDLNHKSDEFERFKEKMIRQLEFLENDNSNLKKSLGDSQQKYYEEKLKWQNRFRELESKLGDSKSQPTTNVSERISASGTIGAIKEYHDSELETRIRHLSKQILTLNQKNHQLEEKCTELEQNLLTNKIDSSIIEDGKEAQELRRKYTDLEHQLRRKTKEIEQIENKLKNQILLEQQIASLTTKQQSNEKLIEDLNVEITKLTSLRIEKDQWTALFEELIRTPVNVSDHDEEVGNSQQVSSRFTSNEITPMSIYKHLNNLQKKCVILSKMKSDFEMNSLELRKQLLILNQKYYQLQQQNIEYEANKDNYNRNIQLKQLHLKTYENEISSLRSLLSLFDKEFQIGKMNENKMISLKDSVIKSLEAELDNCRKDLSKAVEQASQLIGTERELERVKHKLSQSHNNDSVASSGAGSSAWEAGKGGTEVKPPGSQSTASSSVSSSMVKREETEVTRLREQILQLTGQLESLQRATGIDFVPGRTRILHLAFDPSDSSTDPRIQVKSKDEESQPIGVNVFEELRKLRVENKRLKALMMQPHQAEDATRLHGTDSSQYVEDGNHATRSAVSMGASSSAGVAPMDDTNASSSNNNNNVSTMEHGSNLSTADLIKLNKHLLKNNQRLKEIFKERIDSFREAVYLLTGYKVEFTSAEKAGGTYPKLRLLPMYAENPDDYLMFMWRGDVLELLETNFTKKLDNKFIELLMFQNSVPSFLANITMDLVEKRTFMP